MTNTAKMLMYTPDGGCIEFFIDLDTPLTAEQIAVASAAYALLGEQGLLPKAPVQQEFREAIHYVVRREHVQDGKATPVLDLYAGDDSEYKSFRFIVLYLNTDSMIQAFEDAAQLKLSELPLFDSDAPLERGKNPQKDARYMRQLANPPYAVYKINPNATEENKQKKRIFVRWNAATVVNARKLMGQGDNRRIQLPQDTSQPDAPKNAPAPPHAVKKAAVVGYVQLEKGKGAGKFNYVLLDMNKSFIAKLFEGSLLRELGYPVDDWKADSAAHAKRYDLSPMLQCEFQPDGAFVLSHLN